MNNSLAELYASRSSARARPTSRRSDLPAEQRIGLLTQASVLTASAGEVAKTHPVISRPLRDQPHPLRRAGGSADPARRARILDNTIILNGSATARTNTSTGRYYTTNTKNSLDDSTNPIVVAGGKNLGLHPGQSIEVLDGNDMVDLFYTFSVTLGMGLSDFRGSSIKMTI